MSSGAGIVIALIVLLLLGAAGVAGYVLYRRAHPALDEDGFPIEGELPEDLPEDLPIGDTAGGTAGSDVDADVVADETPAPVPGPAAPLVDTKAWLAAAESQTAPPNAATPNTTVKTTGKKTTVYSCPPQGFSAYTVLQGQMCRRPIPEGAEKIGLNYYAPCPAGMQPMDDQRTHCAPPKQEGGKSIKLNCGPDCVKLGALWFHPCPAGTKRTMTRPRYCMPTNCSNNGCPRNNYGNLDTLKAAFKTEI